MSENALKSGERIVRHPNGHLMVERFDPVPTEVATDKAFASLAKAWPVLAKHADHIDGEFDNALSDMRRYVARFRRVIDELREEATDQRQAIEQITAIVKRDDSWTDVERGRAHVMHHCNRARAHHGADQ